jgi:hypothetical protein
MPIDEATTLSIVCDNPECPGNSLDPSDRFGWLFINSEVYGEPVASHVFCSQSCVNAATAEGVDVFEWEDAGDADAVRERSASPPLPPNESEAE